MATDLLEAGPDDAVDGVAARFVARPSSTAEVASVMTAAAEEGLTVVPRGGGTKLGWGPPPTTADVVLDLSAMDAVLDHQAGDLIVEAQAGATLATVRETVGKEGQRLVVDETLPGATVGGSLAAHASGPERLLVGTVRDLLIGVTMVRADGVVAKAGGRVVKNVAGYDLGKLLVGSFGTLGVVTEAIFRLHPVPEAQAWVTAPVADADEAHRLAHAVVHGQSVAAAVEVDLDESGRGTICALLNGRHDGVTQRASAVAATLGSAADVATAPPAGWAAYPWGSGAVGLKLTCVLSGLRDVLTAAAEVGASVRGSAGAGVLYAALPAGDEQAVAAATDRLRQACTAHGGSTVVVEAPPGLERSLDLWGPVPALDLMRRVKDQFDPDHRLAPGRFVGGI
ncbi:FAD-binding oxidoreductase [Nocardioides aestuarii]|uniref:FAD-binding oxidoreductase n=1 Tax=Nocardioides aestuarii TaxID=252231 RepID=A0ABW4TJ23_9ACTN